MRRRRRFLGSLYYYFICHTKQNRQQCQDISLLNWILYPFLRKAKKNIAFAFDFVWCGYTVNSIAKWKPSMFKCNSITVPYFDVSRVKPIQGGGSELGLTQNSWFNSCRGFFSPLTPIKIQIQLFEALEH